MATITGSLGPSSAAGALALNGTKSTPGQITVFAATPIVGASSALLVQTSFGTGVFNCPGLNGGAAFPDCKVVVAVTHGGGSGGVPNTLMFGSIALTMAVQDSSQNAELWYADVTNGTTDTLTFNGNNNTGFYQFACWYLVGAGPGGPAATATQALGVNGTVNTTALHTPFGGAQTALSYGVNSAGSMTTAWTNATRDFNVQNATAAMTTGGASTNVAGPLTITATCSGGTSFNYGMATATWAPAGLFLDGTPVTIVGSSSQNPTIGPITTSRANGVVVISTTTNLNSGQSMGNTQDIQSITGGGLTFTRRALRATSSSAWQGIEEWVANVGSTPLSAVTFTINYGAAPAFGSASLFAFSETSGATVSFDPNGPTTSNTSNAPSAITPANAPNIVFGGSRWLSTSAPTQAAGWVGICTGIGNSYHCTEYDPNTTIAAQTPAYTQTDGNAFYTDAVYASTTTTWQDGATLAGAGSITVTANVIAASSATLAGSGALAVTANLQMLAAGSLAGVGALTAQASVTFSAQPGMFAGAGALSVSSAVRVAAQPGALAGAGSLQASSSVLVAAQPAPMAGAGSLTVDGTIVRAGTTSGAVLSGVGSLTVSATEIAIASATLAGAGGLTVAGRTLQASQVALAGAGSLAVNATVIRAAGAVLAGAGALSVDAGPIRQAGAVLAGAGNIAGAASVVAATGAQLAGAGALSVYPTLRMVASATLAGTGNLTAIASGVTVWTDGAQLAGAGGLQVSAAVIQQARANLAGAGALSVSAGLVRSNAVTLAGAGSLTVDARVMRGTGAVLAGAGAMSARAGVAAAAGASLAGDSSMTAASRSLSVSGTITLQGEGILSAYAAQVTQAQVELDGAGGLTVAAQVLTPFEQMSFHQAHPVAGRRQGFVATGGVRDAGIVGRPAGRPPNG